MFEGGIGDPIEDACFPGHALEIVKIGGFDAAFGSFTDTMHDLDQEGHQGIGDLLSALKHQGGQKRHANGLGVLANMGRRLGGNASPQTFHQFGCIPSKQVRWQADGSQGTQFGDFGQRTLDADRTGVEAQQAQRQFLFFVPLRNWFSHEQHIQALLHLRREACCDDGIDLRFVCQEPRLNQCGNVIWSFDPTGTALGANEFTQTLRMLFMRKNLGAEPVQQAFFVGATELSHLGHLADLRPVGFDGSPFPGILSKQSGIHPNLSGEKAYHFGCHLLPATKKPAFVLQALE